MNPTVRRWKRGVTAAAARGVVCASLDAPALLHPVLGELFRGVPSLGSMPRATAGLLVRMGVTSRWRVLDVGCGKGAFALELAQRSGCRVVGIDGCGVFVEEARAAARRRGLGGRCEFRVGDLRAGGGGFDAACELGVEPMLAAARRLRRRVRAGGLYVVDDAFPERGRAGGFAHMATAEEARRAIGRMGDEVVLEYVPARSVIRALNARLYARLARNAARVAVARPDLRPALRGFLRRQREGNRALNGALRPAVWVMRRGRGERGR